MILEICANSYQSAINAEKAGAHRIELCSELALGGLTPSYGLLKQVIKNITIPAVVLIRPRSGNFTYSDVEFEIMKENIKLCKNLGYAGIVSGILNPDNTIDIEKTKELIQLSKPLPFIFHRAFDWTPKPFKALQQLIDLDVERILTSGQTNSAREGIGVLKDLNKEAGSRVTIMPGGGINSENILVFKITGFNEVHCSATRIKYVNESPKVLMNSNRFFDETVEVTSDIKKISSILKRIEN